jgi:hypothetical protein
VDGFNVGADGREVGIIDGRLVGITDGRLVDVGVNVGLYAQQSVLVGFAGGQLFVGYGIKDTEGGHIGLQYPTMGIVLEGLIPQPRNVGCTDGFEVG